MRINIVIVKVFGQMVNYNKYDKCQGHLCTYVLSDNLGKSAKLWDCVANSH
jgi:hypothetical protein